MDLKELEKKLPLATIGIILTIIFGGVGIYTYLNQLKPSVSFEIIRESNVFDIYKQVDDLEIIFKDKDIKKANLNLRVYTIRISNIGSIDILPNHYAPKIDWGIHLNKGKFLNDVNLIFSNSKYLKENLKFTRINDTRIIMNKLILEKDKIFEFEVLVLHNKEEEPTLKSIGKIAGIEELPIINNAELINENTLLTKIFYGDIFIHLIRFVLYLLLFAVVVFIFVQIDNLRERNRRKERKSLFIQKTQDIFSKSSSNLKIEKMLNSYYLPPNIKDTILIVSNPKNNKEYRNLITLMTKETELYKERKLIREKLDYKVDRHIEFLLENDVLKIKNNKVKIDKIFLKNIEKLSSALDSYYR